jgi:hypothetical protein
MMSRIGRLDGRPGGGVGAVVLVLPLAGDYNGPILAGGRGLVKVRLRPPDVRPAPTSPVG